MIPSRQNCDLRQSTKPWLVLSMRTQHAYADFIRPGDRARVCASLHLGEDSGVRTFLPGFYLVLNVSWTLSHLCRRLVGLAWSEYWNLPSQAPCPRPQHRSAAPPHSCQERPLHPGSMPHENVCSGRACCDTRIVFCQIDLSVVLPQEETPKR